MRRLHRVTEPIAVGLVATMGTALLLGVLAALVFEEQNGSEVRPAVWLLAAAVALGVGVRTSLLAHRARLRRDRASDGLCPSCGYDIRATPERCPECGSPVGRPPCRT